MELVMVLKGKQLLLVDLLEAIAHRFEDLENIRFENIMHFHFNLCNILIPPTKVFHNYLLRTPVITEFRLGFVDSFKSIIDCRKLNIGIPGALYFLVFTDIWEFWEIFQNRNSAKN